MADKFEFKKQKPLQLLASSYQIKKKPSLSQYKQVIIQLNDAVNQLSQENEAIKISANGIAQKNKQLMGDIRMKQRRIEQLQSCKRATDEQLVKQNVIIEELKILLAECESKMSEMENKIRKYEQKLEMQLQKRNRIQKINETNEQKMKILEQTLESALEQNKSMKIEVVKNSKYNQQQAQELKQFSNGLKKKFQVFDLTVPVLPDNHYSQSYSFINPEEKYFQIRQKKSFSTQKKTRRNIGHLSSTNGLNWKNRQYENQILTRHHPIKPFQIALTNPEISHQLQNIKKQIANQYTLINLKHESYSKQRVTKTLQALQNIKRKAGRAVMQAMQTGSQSQNQMGREY